MFKQSLSKKGNNWEKSSTNSFNILRNHSKKETVF